MRRQSRASAVRGVVLLVASGALAGGTLAGCANRAAVEAGASGGVAGASGGAESAAGAGSTQEAGAPETASAAATGSGAAESGAAGSGAAGSGAGGVAPATVPAPAPTRAGPPEVPAELAAKVPPAGVGQSPAVILEGTVVACIYDGLYTDGDSCPETVSGTSAAGLQTGPVQLIRATAKGTRAGPDAGPCAELWEATPVGPRVTLATGRTLTVLPTDNDRYQKILGETYGIEAPNITALARIDLDGDGAEEVLFAIDSHPGRWPFDEKGLSYSYVGVRRIQAGTASTVETLNLFDHRNQLKGESPMEHLRGELLGVTDLEGDGKLEVVVQGSYYEGRAWNVWQVQGGKPVRLLGGAGCGA